MKAITKVVAGMALASLAVAQPVLAAAPRAMDARTVSEPKGEVVSLRQTPTVRKSNKSTSGVMVGVLGFGAFGLGVAAAAGAFSSSP